MDHSTLFIVAVVAVLISDILLFLLGYLLRREPKPEPVGTPQVSGPTTNETQLLNHSVMSLIKRLAQFEERLKQIETRQEETRFRDADGQAFEVAAKLVRKGASVDELVSVCGISRGEAELIINLHDNKA